MVAPESIGRFRKTEEFYLQVARGQVQGHSIAVRSGYNPDVHTGAPRSLWDHGPGLQPFPAAASVVTLSSSSALDTAAGTGARVVLVSGLDAAYNPVDCTVVLNGQTPVSSTVSFLRIFNLTVLSAGSGGYNAGDIYAGTGAVTAGVPAVVLMRIRPTNNASQSAAYTVPAGYTAFLVDVFASAMESSINKSTVFYLRVSKEGSPFVRTGNVVTAGNSSVLAFVLLRSFPEKTDIDATLDTTDTNIIASGQLRYLLIKNDTGNA